MLTYLSVRNYALIDTVTLEFSEGMTVLTGETGAGKSILIGALCLVLGGRADTDSFRNPEEPVAVQAVFDLSRYGAVRERIAELVGADEPDACAELIIRREIRSNGKNRCLVNAQVVGVAQLKDIGASLVDIHGQHDHERLFDPACHRQFLDAYGGISALVAAYTEQYGAYRELVREREACLEQEGNKLRELDMLNFQITEIEEAGLTPDEDIALERERAVMTNAGKISSCVERAYALLYEDQAAVIDQLAAARSALEELARYDESARLYIAGIEQASIEVADIARGLEQYRDGLPADGHDIDYIQSRLEVIARLKRKYGSSIAEINAHAAACVKQRDALEGNEQRLAELGRAIDTQEKGLVKKAQVLHEKRSVLAGKLKKEIEKELKDIAMADAVFTVQVEADALHEYGSDRVEFFIATNKGETAKPLCKIASGGEAARIMLALKRILARVDQVTTLIFDEIDANIGGRLGKTVGAKIREIAKERQVLLITHLPQIASCADTHIKVDKIRADKRTTTACRVLNPEERVEELAHMLSGHEVTEVSHAHAREMMEDVHYHG